MTNYCTVNKLEDAVCVERLPANVVSVHTVNSVKIIQKFEFQTYSKVFVRTKKVIGKRPSCMEYGRSFVKKRTLLAMNIEIFNEITQFKTIDGLHRP